MFKNVILAGAILSVSLPAIADSWNSNQNIERAMSAAIDTYKGQGVAGLVRESENCYAGLDTSRRNKNVGRDVEYCISYVFSGVVIDRHFNKPTNTQDPYFTNGEVLLRAMHALEAGRIVTRPEEYPRYFSTHMDKIAREVPPRL